MGIASLSHDGRSVPPFKVEHMAFSSFLDGSLRLPEEDAARRRLYLQQVPLAQYLPELEEIGLPFGGPAVLREAVGHELLVTSTFFAGAGGVRTSLHFDRG